MTFMKTSASSDWWLW